MYWDTSAIVACWVAEHRSEDTRPLLQTDEEISVWWGTRVEFVSALERKRRDGLALQIYREALRRLDKLLAEADEVQPSTELRDIAVQLLARRPLSTLDALQLAAARIAGGGSGEANPSMVCLDK